MCDAEILCVFDPSGGQPASKVMNLEALDRLTEWFIELHFAAKNKTYLVILIAICHGFYFKNPDLWTDKHQINTYKAILTI